MENAFYFTLKAFFILKVFKHLLWFHKKGLIRKIWLILKIMTSQQTIAIHKLPNISRSKGNQKMKLDQLIEYNMRYVFVEKPRTKCGGETIPRPCKTWLRNLDLWINSVKFQTVWFYCMLIWGLSKHSEINLQTTCFYLISLAFI